MPGKNSNTEVHFILEWILVEIGRRESPVEDFLFVVFFFFFKILFLTVCACVCVQV